MITVKRLAAVLFVLAGTTNCLWAQQRPATKRERTPPQPQLAVHGFREVSISPDGRYLAWLGSKAENQPSKPPEQAIYVTDLHSSTKTPRRVTAGDSKTYHAEHGIAWSPDGSQVAFLSDAAKK